MNPETEKTAALNRESFASTLADPALPAHVAAVTSFLKSMITAMETGDPAEIDRLFTLLDTGAAHPAGARTPHEKFLSSVEVMKLHARALQARNNHSKSIAKEAVRVEAENAARLAQLQARDSAEKERLRRLWEEVKAEDAAKQGAAPSPAEAPEVAAKAPAPAAPAAKTTRATRGA